MWRLNLNNAAVAYDTRVKESSLGSYTVANGENTGGTVALPSVILPLKITADWAREAMPNLGNAIMLLFENEGVTCDANKCIKRRE